MANYDAAARVVNATLSGTTIDSVTLTKPWEHLEVLNRSATSVLWVTYAQDSGTPPPDPTVEGEDVDPVMPGERLSLPLDTRHTTLPTVKILGNGGGYSVIGSL